MKMASTARTADATTSQERESAMPSTNDRPTFYACTSEIIRDPEIRVSRGKDGRLGIHVGSVYMSMDVVTWTQIAVAVTRATNLDCDLSSGSVNA